jgi:hypothetical protein
MSSILVMPLPVLFFIVPLLGSSFSIPSTIVCDSQIIEENKNECMYVRELVMYVWEDSE